jgi:hypothetical protein
MDETPKVHRRRWYQFNLRSLFVVMTLACVGMSWLGIKIQQARRQKEAVEEIKKLGGGVFYDYQVRVSGVEMAKLKPKWLRSLLGDDFFTNVVIVWLATNQQVTDAGLEQLKGLTTLTSLSLDGTKVTDAGLEQLKGLTTLTSLSLDGTMVTDAGLEHLKGLTQLQDLSLDSTKVTDAGLEHLKGLTQLQTLSLFNTQVTDKGVKKLQQVLPNCQILH